MFRIVYVPFPRFAECAVEKLSGHDSIGQEAWMKMQQTFRLAALMIAMAFLAGECSAQTLGVRMDQIVQPYADAQLFMGSVLVAQNGNVLLSKGYGWADVEWKIPNSPSTRFQLASMTKQFTAASILLLEDRGKLKTDDLVKKYFPDAPGMWDKITIYNLLTHASGIANGAATYEPTSPDKLIFHDIPLDFKPGEQWAYSNLGYDVLGYLVERVSGQTYANFVQQNVFTPLRMNDSGYDSNITIIPHRASGYWQGADGIENAERTNLSLAFSAGGLYSTTEDLLKWEEGLFGGKLLTPTSLHKMITPFKNNYACGLYVNRTNGRLEIEHSGNGIGFNTDMAYYPEDKLAVIILGNLNGTVTGKITNALAAVMHGETVELAPPPAEIALPLEVLSRYVGTYQFPDYSVVVVIEGHNLVFHFDDGGMVLVFAESENRFFSKVWDMQLEFSKNEKGEFAFVTRHQDGNDTQGTKK
jgi:CubicO group peptidase (beta-lactamase class C family)